MVIERSVAERVGEVGEAGKVGGLGSMGEEEATRRLPSIRLESMKNTEVTRINLRRLRKWMQN